MNAPRLTLVPRAPEPGATWPPGSDFSALMALIREIRHADLRRYCIDQIRTARSPEEADAAVSLAQAVARKRA